MNKVKKRKFTIYVEEHLVKTVVVTANSEYEAREKVRKAYMKQELVLTADDYNGVTLIGSDTADWEAM